MAVTDACPRCAGVGFKGRGPCPNCGEAWPVPDQVNPEAESLPLDPFDKWVRDAGLM